MTKTELKKYRTQLTNKRSDLGSTSGNREALAIETSPDDLDRIQNANERDYAMRNLERNSARLREVETALRRADAGTFGVCLDCEEEIGSRRLTAVPWAPLCIVCQERADLEPATRGYAQEPGMELAA